MSDAVVALHGFSCAPAMWAEVLPEADAPPLLGHAPSAPPGASTSFVQEVDRLADVARERAGPGAHLVGYSMGARVALGISLRHPQLVGRLTLIGANPGLEDDTARRERKVWEDGWRRVLEEQGIHAFADAWEALPLWESQRALAEPVRLRQCAARRAHDPRGLSAALAVLGLASMPNLWPELARLRAPVQLVAGALDAKFVALARRMAERAPTARVVTVPGAGHNPVLEAPRFVARIVSKPGWASESRSEERHDHV